MTLFLVFKKDEVEDNTMKEKEIALKEKYQAKEENEQNKEPEYITGFI